MARKKTEEELALEAEFAAAKKTRKQLNEEAKAARKAAKRQAKLEGEVQAGVEVAGGATSKLPGELADKLSFFKTKRGIGALAAGVVVVVLAVAGIYSFAFSMSTDAWDGSADTSWYNPDEANQTKDGEPVAYSMTITEAEQLAGMRKLCNEGVRFDGWSFTLGRNLDLGDIETNPIGYANDSMAQGNRFEGSFDGANHTISGINVMEDEWDHAGLFGSFGGPELKNLTVEGKVTGQVRVGGVAGEVMGSEVSNLTNRCTVASLKTATNYYPVTVDCGGVLGIYLCITSDRESATVSNLVNEGEVSARAANAGGVTGTIAGSDNFTLDVHDLTNNGKVTVFCESEARDEAVGGVVGVVGGLGKSAYRNLLNNGEVSCSTVCNVGGVVGSMQPADTQGGSFKNTGRVAANAQTEIAHVGGVFGYLEHDDLVMESDGAPAALNGLENTGEMAATNGNSDDLYSTGDMERWDEWEDAHPDNYA